MLGRKEKDLAMTINNISIQPYAERIYKLITKPSAMAVALLCYVIAYAANPHAGDIEFWRTWISQVDQGYHAINANYPPILLHWYWLLIKIHSILGLSLPLDNTIVVKFWSTLPSLATHLAVCFIAERYLEARGKRPLENPVFWLFLINPAILLNGPIWGQVDYMTVLFTAVSVWAACRHNFLLAAACFSISILCKFQAIVVLPVLAGLYLNGFNWQRLKEVPNIVFGLVIPFFLAYLPYIIAGNATEALKAAYMGNTDLYPYATYFAANIWYLLLGNATDMNAPLFGLWQWLTPKNLGYGLFIAFSSAVMIRTATCTRDTGIAFALTAFMYLIFFAIAPSMHERYMFAFVPLCFLAWSYGRLSGSWFTAGTIIVGLNQLLVLPISGEDAWRAVSLLTLILAITASFKFLLGRAIDLTKIGTFGILFSIILMLTFTILAFSNARTESLSFDKQGQLNLADFSPKFEQQGWGVFRPESTSGNHFNYKYESRLRVHADSQLIYELPDGSTNFSGIVAMQEKGKSGRVRFQILLDNDEAWISGTITGNQMESFTVDTSQAKTLELRVLSGNSKDSDHAQWLDPVVRN